MTGAFFVAILLIGVPISFVLTISAALYVWLSGNHTLYGSYMQQLFSGIESYGLLAIPLFMLTGELMNAGGSPGGWSRWRACSSAASAVGSPTSTS